MPNTENICLLTQVVINNKSIKRLGFIQMFAADSGAQQLGELATTRLTAQMPLVRRHNFLSPFDHFIFNVFHIFLALHFLHLCFNIVQFVFMHILNDFFYCHSIISGYLCLWAWNTTRFRGVLFHLPVLWRQRQPNPHARRDMRPRWVLLRIRRLPLWTPCELPHLLHKGPHRVIIRQFPAHIFFLSSI